MADRLYAKYMWLISTIYDAGKISFEGIARKWDDANINDLRHMLLSLTHSSYLKGKSNGKYNVIYIGTCLILLA